MTKIKKNGQSALEYMMTYGWAILIIVIVAVILYSMGIFNPRGAITPTSTGFAPFSVSAAICNSSGLYFMLHASFPGSIGYGYLDKIYFTSALSTNITSGSYSLNNAFIIGGSSKLINLPQLICKLNGVTFSLTSILTYTENVPSVGNQTYNTTGTISGTAS
jgi:hypothetical protein